jgi:UDP-glucose 4-epimerase
LVENPRAGDESLTDTFTVDTTAAEAKLDWSPERDVESVIQAAFEGE